MEQITIQGLSFTYPDGAYALQDVSFSVNPGEFVTLCGLSGCGKSTLLRLMKPGLFPRGELSGSVLFSGKAISAEPDRDSAQKIGFVMQSPDAQAVTDKVWHELAFSCESVGLPQAEIRRRVGEMAGYFGLSELFERETDTLSGGQKQLLCLASAAALHPDVLLLDEPTSQLDPIAAQGFIDAVRRLNRDFGVTVITAEHRLEELLPISDRVIVLDGGKVLADCSPALLAEKLPAGHPMERALTAAPRVFRAAGGSALRRLGQDFTGRVARNFHETVLRRSVRAYRRQRLRKIHSSESAVRNAEALCGKVPRQKGRFARISPAGALYAVHA